MRFAILQSNKAILMGYNYINQAITILKTYDEHTRIRWSHTDRFQINIHDMLKQITYVIKYNDIL
jgi:hypothetical protein